MYTEGEMGRGVRCEIGRDRRRGVEGRRDEVIGCRWKEG